MAVYSVSQINRYIKNMFQQDFLLNNVSVEGEISTLKDHPSGHLYFTLKDNGASIACVMFAGNRSRGLKCRPKAGMRVVLTGNVDVYEASGQYQIYVKTMVEKGQGDLYKEFLALKERLEEMGMFDASYKKPVPKYARTVGIVTSSSGAALQDILNVAQRRNPYVKLILSPALVQGTEAPLSLVKAIEKLDAFRPDVMIVGRGGGSLEDLWAFNDERVAKAIFDCDTPVISAVGHEVDFTIADFVSDLRAPTPSAAAELAVFESNAYLELLARDENILIARMEQKIQLLKQKLTRQNLRLQLNHPRTRLEKQQEQVGKLEERLIFLMTERVHRTENRLRLLAESLNGCSPLRKLTGGYGYLETKGSPVSSVRQVKEGDLLTVILQNGRIDSSVTRVEEKRDQNE